jgi:hypothetical protein
MVKRKIPRPLPGLEPPIQPVAPRQMVDVFDACLGTASLKGAQKQPELNVEIVDGQLIPGLTNAKPRVHSVYRDFITSY